MLRRSKILMAAILLLMLGLVIAWFSGGAAVALLHLAEHQLLPYRAGKEFTVTGVGQVEGEPGPAEDGVRLTVSQARVRKALAEAGGWGWAVPPGLLRDGLTIEGAWSPRSHGQSVGITIPVEIQVGGADGDHPRLAGTLPVSMLNAYMAVEFAEDFVNENEEYLLGHFDYTFRPTILEATVQTTNHPGLSADAYAAQLGLDVRARGTVKLKFEENLFRTSTDASISDLRLLINAVPRPTDEGVTIDYDARFTRLKANVRKLHNIGDRMVSDKLEKKWTRSLNREKRKKRLAQHVLPPWAPLDLAIDLAFYPEG